MSDEVVTVTYGPKKAAKAPHPPSWSRYVKEGEKPSHHRAFLLWAMQDPSKRSVKRVGIAMHRRDNVVWTWSKRWVWADRVALYGASAQHRAIQAYRAIYFREFSLHEIAMVEQNMSVPFSTTGPPPDEESGIGEAGRLATKHYLEAGDDKATMPIPKRDDPAAHAQRVLRKGLMIIEASISRYGALLANEKEAKGLVRKMDVGKLLKEHREITTLLGDLTPAQQGGPVLEPSYRVQLARRCGTSVIAAMRDDAEEVFAVTRALAAAEAVTASTGAPTRDPDAGEEAIEIRVLDEASAAWTDSTLRAGGSSRSEC